jgi:hypothetical protein
VTAHEACRVQRLDVSVDDGLSYHAKPLLQFGVS